MAIPWQDEFLVPAYIVVVGVLCVLCSWCLLLGLCIRRCRFSPIPPLETEAPFLIKSEPVELKSVHIIDRPPARRPTFQKYPYVSNTFRR
jgi:hypothetical protein